MLGEMKYVLKLNIESLHPFEPSFTLFTQYAQEDLALTACGRKQIFYHNSVAPNETKTSTFILFANISQITAPFARMLMFSNTFSEIICKHDIGIYVYIITRIGKICWSVGELTNISFQSLYSSSICRALLATAIKCSYVFI